MTGPRSRTRPTAVAARAAKKVTVAATLGHRDVRGGSPVRAGTYAFEVGEEVVTGWHWHDLHQLEYAVEGVAQVETATARYLLPPQQAIWIPAGVEHCTTLTRVRTVSVFFDPALDLDAGERVQVLAVAPVLREMIGYARRWPIRRSSSDKAADTFFAALADLVVDPLGRQALPRGMAAGGACGVGWTRGMAAGGVGWTRGMAAGGVGWTRGMAACGVGWTLSLPTSRDPLVAAVMRFTVEHLQDVTLNAVCAAVGTSQRSLRRIFLAETGMSWRQYLLESRLLQAMALLAEPGPTVLSVATTVGFASTSGFSRAFRRYTGETPYGYRRRILNQSVDLPT